MNRKAIYNYLVSSIMKENRKRAGLTQVQASAKSQFVSLFMLRQFEQFKRSPNADEFFELMNDVYGFVMTQDEYLFFCISNPLRQIEVFSNSFWHQYGLPELAS